MTGGLNVQGAFLVGAFIGVMLYGLYGCLFVLTMLTMKRHRGAARNISIVMVSLFALATVSIVLQILDIYEAFIKREPIGGPLPYFANRHERKLAVVIDTLMYVSGNVADGLICWRLYVIWNRNRYILIAPLIILFGGIVCGAIAVGYEVRQTIIGDSRFMAKVDMWALIAFGVSVVTNLLMTGLIAGKIWRIAHYMSPLNQESQKLYNNTVAALIESGAVYSVVITVFVIVAAVGLIIPRIVISYMLPMVIGITPTLIVLRLNIGVPGSRYGTNPTVRSTNVAPSNLTFARAPTTQLESQYPPGRLNSTTLTTFGEEEDKYSVKDQGASSSTVQIELRKVTKVEVKNSEDKTVPVIPHQPSTSHG